MSSVANNNFISDNGLQNSHVNDGNKAIYTPYIHKSHKPSEYHNSSKSHKSHETNESIRSYKSKNHKDIEPEKKYQYSTTDIDEEIYRIEKAKKFVKKKKNKTCCVIS